MIYMKLHIRIQIRDIEKQPRYKREREREREGGGGREQKRGRKLGGVIFCLIPPLHAVDLSAVFSDVQCLVEIDLQSWS